MRRMQGPPPETYRRPASDADSQGSITKDKKANRLPTCGNELPADRIHRPRRRHELPRVDLMAFPLAREILPNQRRDLLIRRARPDEPLHIVFLDREQAVPQLAVG